MARLAKTGKTPILVFDEAHNVGESAEDFTSFNLDEKTILNAKHFLTDKLP